MIYVISQLIGLMAFGISLLAYHRNKKEKILGSMILSNFLNLVHYLLLDAYSGCITKVVAVIRDSFIIFKKNDKVLSSKLFMFLFIGVYIGAGFFTYDGMWSLFPLVAATIYIIPVWNGNEMTVKKTALFCHILWLIYNISVLSVVGIISYTISIISTFIAVKNTSMEKQNSVVKGDIIYGKSSS